MPLPSTSRSRCASLLALAGALLGCTGEHKEPPAGVLSVSIEQTSAWVENFNPLLPAGSSRWPTRNGVYEPMMIFNGVTNTDLLAEMNRVGVPAVGLTGVDAGMIKARKRAPMYMGEEDGRPKLFDYGLVGDIEHIDPKLLKHLLEADYVSHQHDDLGHSLPTQGDAWESVAHKLCGS